MRVEYEHQKALAIWWAVEAPRHGLPVDLLFSIQNGARTSFGTAKKLKESGGRRGVPDLMLAICCGIHPGLFIEMKRPSGGVVSRDQREFMELLKWQGYRVIVANGWDEARCAIEKYLMW